MHPGGVGACSEMKVAILLFTSPVQHDNSEHVLEIAKGLAASGNEVRIFLLGDGVYNASTKLVTDRVETVVSRIRDEHLDMTACTTCATFRGVDSVVEGAKLGTLEDLVDMVEECDVLLNFTSEA